MDCPAIAPVPKHSQPWDWPPARFVSVEWCSTRPSVGPQTKMVGLDLLANWGFAQHVTAARVDYLIGVVSFLVGK